MNSGSEIINTKQLRDELPRVVRRVREGRRFLVLHRSRPAFELVPPGDVPSEWPPLEKDPIFRMSSLGRSRDGLTTAEHDKVLYGR